MRKRVPSSAFLSNVGATDWRLAWTLATSEPESTALHLGAPCTWHPCDTSRSTPNVDVHVEGNNGPASSAANSLLKKSSFLRRRTSSSSSISSRNWRRYSELVSGGMKSSPSLRLSDSSGSKSAFRRVLSSSANVDPALRLVQKTLLKTTCESGNRKPPPLSLLASTSRGVDRSKLSRLRSTPFGRLRGADLTGRNAVTGSTVLTMVIAPCGGCTASALMVLPGTGACTCAVMPAAEIAVTRAAPNLTIASMLRSTAFAAFILARA
mmetsp:Transcript_65075/g.151149  ORF Transcript_65075/g.151149 Transcript_65075/m.151149 type:complete len:266 (-) Transcript_65075:1786-2583(-)